MEEHYRDGIYTRSARGFSWKQVIATYLVFDGVFRGRMGLTTSRVRDVVDTETVCESALAS